eukprot:2391853-Rhodomonas_salina.3
MPFIHNCCTKSQPFTKLPGTSIMRRRTGTILRIRFIRCRNAAYKRNTDTRGTTVALKSSGCDAVSS